MDNLPSKRYFELVQTYEDYQNFYNSGMAWEWEPNFPCCWAIHLEVKNKYEEGAMIEKQLTFRQEWITFKAQQPLHELIENLQKMLKLYEMYSPTVSVCGSTVGHPSIVIHYKSMETEEEALRREALEKEYIEQDRKQYERLKTKYGW